MRDRVAAARAAGRAILAAALAVALLASAAPAQVEAVRDWEVAATRAERALALDAISDEALEDLRAEMAEFREAFLDSRDANAGRLATVESQVEALGPAPEEGAEEPAGTAARRAELEAQREELLAPRRAASESLSRAQGLIDEIDATLRDRQAAQLREAGPTPLNPELWRPAAVDLAEAGRRLVREPVEALERPGGAPLTRTSVPLLIGLVLFGVALLTGARRWLRAPMRWAERRLPLRAQGAAVFAISLGQVILPVAGAALIARAAAASGLAGPVWDSVLRVLPAAAFQLYGAFWLGGWLFSRSDRWARVLDLSPAARREGRAYAAILGAAFAGAVLLGGLASASAMDWPAETRAVVNAPFVLVIGIILFRMGRVLSSGAQAAPQDADGAAPAASEGGAFGTFVARQIGRATMLAGIAGPILAALGYDAAATALVYPAVLTLALIGILVILQQFVRDLYALAGRRDDGAEDALLPVLIGFVLGIVALPLLALIWGARVSDLTELWARVRQGVTIGETVISPEAILAFALLFAIGLTVTRLLQRALRTQILPRTKLDVGGRTAIVSGLGYVGIFLAGLIAITGAGFDLTSLAFIFGALSVGIGFGLQNVVSNFVSGIILLIERPISEGDWIDVGGNQGYVRAISVRSTRIETFDRTDVIVPNADLIAGTVTNYTRGNLVGRLIAPVGVAYGTDTRKVEGILREIAEAHPMVSLAPPPSILFRGFGASSLDFEIRAILRDVNWVMSVHSDMNHAIAARFAAEGIEIPFPQTDVWMRPAVPGGAPEAEEA